jgi:hypothetical protein
LAPLLYALSAFPQSGLVSVNHPDPPPEETIQPIREDQILAAPDLTPFEPLADDAAIPASWDDSSPTLGNVSEEESRGPAPVKRSQPSKAADANRDIHYRNKIEFSLDGGWLLNISANLSTRIFAWLETLLGAWANAEQNWKVKRAAHRTLSSAPSDSVCADGLK